MFLPFWNSAEIFTGSLEKKHSYFCSCSFQLRKSKLYEGRDSTLKLFTFPFSFLSWFSLVPALFCSVCQFVSLWFCLLVTTLIKICIFPCHPVHQ